MVSDAAAQQAQVDLDQTNYDRAAMLLKSGTATQAVYDQAQYTLQNDKSKLAALREQSQVQLAKLGGNPDIVVTEHPQYLQAQAQVDEAQRQLDHTVVDGAVRRHCHRRAVDCAGKISRRFDDRFLPRRYRSRLGRRDTERDRADLRPAGPAGDGDSRYLSGSRVARRRRERQPGGRAGISLAAGAKYQRQLGEGRAARADARPPRHQRQELAAAARRLERRGRCRYRTRARLCRTSSRRCSAAVTIRRRNGSEAHGVGRQSRRRSPSA